MWAVHRQALELTVLLAILTGYHCTEYCWEAFNATCPPGEVILMTYAFYGRMAIGKCITTNYKIGCKKDVLTFMDRKCSGRHDCTLEIPNTDLQRESGCRKDLMSYLNASYECIKVARPKGDISTFCSSGSTVLHTETYGFLSSLVSMETSAGTARCPWVVSVPKGQKVNVTLLDFNVTSPSVTKSEMCAVYATLRDVGGSTNITVCGGEARRKVVYLSDTNMLKIQINSHLVQSKPPMPHFVLKYEAVGCPDRVAPPGGWVERRENKMAMGCNETGEVRHLVCNGNSWVGEMSNCSGSLQSAPRDNTGSGRKDVSFGLVLAIVIGVILGIIIGSLLLGVVLYTQNRLKNRPRHGSTLAQREASELEKTQILQSGNYGYAHVWELQQLRTGPEGSEPRATIRTVGVCPGEFGSHLGKPPGFQGGGPVASRKDHSYESPRFNPATGGHIHTLTSGQTGPRLTDPTATMLPKCHEFDVHIKTTLGGNNPPRSPPQQTADTDTEARYTD